MPSPSIATWSIRPARHAPVKAVAAAAVILFAALLTAFNLGPFAGLLALAFLVLQTLPFFAPTHFTVDENGAELRRLWRVRRRAWGELRRVSRGPSAVLLSPFRTEHSLERRRGILLDLTGAPEGTVELIESLMVRGSADPAAPSPGAGT